MKLKLLSVILIIWFCVICAILVAIDHKNVPFIENPIPQWLRPGQIAPPMGSCEWRYLGSADLISCVENSVTYMYDLHSHVIKQVSLIISDRPVGDYLAAWGKPTGYSSNYHSHQIYWGNLQIWIYGKHFGPESPAFIISMSDRDLGRGPWRGFRNWPAPTAPSPTP